MQNPKLTTTLTNTVIGNPPSIPFPVGTYQFSSLQPRQCASGSASGIYYEPDQNGQATPVGAFTYNDVCSYPWTYGGGVSPLGQKVNFLTRSRVQPYMTANAGFVAFAKTVPADDATMFNFTFEFGGGVEWNTSAGRAWSLDYRYHHISNAGRGMSNPGVDNGTVSTGAQLRPVSAGGPLFHRGCSDERVEGGGLACCIGGIDGTLPERSETTVTVVFRRRCFRHSHR